MPDFPAPSPLMFGAALDFRRLVIAWFSSPERIRKSDLPAEESIAAAEESIAAEEERQVSSSAAMHKQTLNLQRFSCSSFFYF